MLRHIRSLSCCLLCIVTAAYAQVGIGTATPNTKSILELNTTSKGLLLPRLTTAQRTAIGATAAEDGMIVFDTDLDSLMLYQAATNSWRSLGFTAAGWNLIGNAGTNPATHYIGTSDAQSLVMRTSGIERIRISATGNVGVGTATPNAELQLSNKLSNRKLVLYESANNDHEVAALGINSGIFRYQVPAVSNEHAFYAATSSTASTTLFRILGNGRVKVPNTSVLDLDNGIGNKRIVLFEAVANDHEFNGLGINPGVFRYQAAATTNDHVFYAATGATTSNELMRIKGTGNVGIGTSTPSAKLHIAANAGPVFRLVDGTEGAGKVLVSDAVGNASWQTPVSNDWSLAGNAGTNPANHYIGTSDAQSLRFKVNNQFSGLIEYAPNDGNTAFGYKTIVNLSTGGAQRNVAMGDNVLGALTTGDDNTGIGYRALLSNTTGNANTAVGSQALHLNTGNANTAVGAIALLDNTTGFANTAIGHRALLSNTTGYNNVATGINALAGNTGGIGNVAVGRSALYSNTTGFGNAATGRDALYANTIGSKNTAVGDSAGLTNTTGTRNTYLGYLANANANNYTNSTAIGANARVDASNAMVLGSINGVNGATANTNVGIGTTLPNAALDVARDLALRAVAITLPAAGTLHNYDLNTSRASLYRITNIGVAVTFTGFTGGVDGRIVTLHNNSGSNITLNNLDMGSAPGNQILTGTGVPITISNNGTVTLQYDAANSRWFVVSTQGSLLAAAPINGWSLNGNAFTNPATHYIGTSDAQSLRFRVNNQFSGLIEYAPNNGNTAFGYKTIVNLSTGGAQRNVAIGDSVLGALTNGDDNTGIGYRSLASNTIGDFNTAVGSQALWLNTGSYNTATGAWALYSNTTGWNNTATGAGALSSNTTGHRNVATGLQALYSNTTGGGNVATGSYALTSNSTGWQNTAVGDSAGLTNTTGTRNTYLGYLANANANNYTNSTAIGHAAVVRASNSMMFGNNAVTNWSFGRTTAPTAGVALEVGTAATNGNGAYLTSGGVWTNASDRNLKTNIMNLSGAEILAKIGRLPITRWTYKGTNETHIGPMAQDFYRLFNVGLDSVSISTIDPSGVALIGIQELKRQVESLNAENDAQQAQIEALQQENAELKKDNAELKKDNTALKEFSTKLEAELTSVKASFEARLKSLEDRAGIKAEK